MGNKYDSKYNFHAQSLVDSNIWDEFGFIEKTKNKWDFEIDKTGDISSYQNLEYYYKKYNGVDSLIGDCKVPFPPFSENKRNLSAVQLIYGLLFPRVGGNFIIKTHSINYDIQFLSLLYTCCAKFDKVYIVKASRNIWSSEMYVVGINKKKLDNDEISNLFSIEKSMLTENIKYPVNHIIDSFFSDIIILLVLLLIFM